MARKTEHLTVAGKRLEVANLDKVFYPGGKFTKAKVIDYYIKISRYLLPHLKDRPVTLKRFPEGVFGEFFYEKDAPAFTPAWVKTVAVPRRLSRDQFFHVISHVMEFLGANNQVNVRKIF